MSERDPRDEELAQLAAEIPWDRPDESRREAVRGALVKLARDEGQPPVVSRRAWRIGGAALATGLAASAAIALVVGAHGSSGAAHGLGRGVPRALATVEAGRGASYERHVEATPTGSDEVVRVHAGTLHVAVGALAAGDRMRIDSGDAEVDGQGELDVTVVADALDHVTVRSGTARVVVQGQHAVFLASGQTWHAATITATEELVAPTPTPMQPLPTPTPTPGPVMHVAPSVVKVTPSVPVAIVELPRARTSTSTSATIVEAPKPKPAPEAPVTPATPAPVVVPSSVEQHFQRGTQLLRSGRADEAAAELAAAADASPGAALAIDARYFQAVALIKANRPADAERALIAFLDRAGTSPRRGRASVMLARLLATHDRGSARAWFQAALHDPDPSVAAAAASGLGTVSHLSTNGSADPL